MKLLILTQKIDKNDPVLGFFHKWLEEFAKNFESIIVICLERGEYNLPANVQVLSLGKEVSVSKFTYIKNFYKYVWQKRAQYSHIFVHMNQEYVILGWKIWKLLGKKIYLWRNHAKGNLLTRLAVLVSNKVFYTSPKSFTAQFKKAVQMPVGIDLDFFKPGPNISRTPNSILFLGRISPVKKVLEFIDWVEKESFDHITIAGPILFEDREYGEKVKERIRNNPKINLRGPMTQEEARELYQSHETYANFTPAGSMDKTIFEALACGMRLEVRNPDALHINIEEHNLKSLMSRLKQEIT